MMQQFKTAILLASLSGLMLAAGSLFGGYQGLQIALIMAIAVNLITYFFSASLVLRMYRAQSLDRTQYAHIYSMVQQLARTMQLPMPTLWIIKTPMANAFATGRNPSHAAVAITTGILDLLTERELRGVLAHELSHIKNRDILVSTIAATLASAIGYIAYTLKYAALFSTSKDRGRGNIVGIIIISLIMPIAAALIQLALSRSREYLADSTGATCCQDPQALADALRKLHGHIPSAHLDQEDMRHASTASLFIVHPFCGRGLSELFSTHPPLAQRVARLERMQATFDKK